MSLNLGVLSAAVTLSDTQYVNTLNGLEKKSDETFQKIAKAALDYITVNAFVDFGKKAIQTFSDLEEATNKFNVVFAGFTDKAEKSVDELIEKFGQSELSAKQMLSGTGDILTGFGFDRKAALDMSVLAAKLGADLASFSNYAGGAKGASEALTKAMLGETEMAKMLGIVIRQDSDEFKALAQQALSTGIDVDKSGNVIKVNTEQQAKALAALALAYQQSPNAIGDFVRSQDSIANQTQILKNNLDTLYATIGKDGSSAYADALQGLNALLSGYAELEEGTRSLINNAVILTGAFAVLHKVGVTKVVQSTIAGTLGAIKYTNHLLILKQAGSAVTFSQRKLAASIAGSAGAANFATIAIAALALTLAACYAVTEREKAQLQMQVDLSSQYVDKLNKESEVLKERQKTDQDRLMRLEELSKYEKLTNSEKEEANKLAEELTKTYGDLGISIDSITGKLNFNAEAWSKLTEKQRDDAYIDARKKFEANKKLLKDMAIASWHDVVPHANFYWQAVANSLPQIVEMENIDAAIAKLEDIRSKTAEIQNTEGQKRIQDLINLLQKQKQRQKEINDIQNSGDMAAKEAAERRRKSQQQQNEEQRKALMKLSDTEWNIEFNAADTEKKAQLVSAKIDKIFEEYKNKSGKYNSMDEFLNTERERLNKDEIETVEKILKLKEQEKNLTKQAADEAERKNKAQNKDLADAQKRYEKMVQDRQAFLAKEASDRIEQQLRNLQNTGNTAGYNQLLQQELKKAQDAATKARSAYLDAVATAEKESKKQGGVSRETDDKVRELKRLAETAQQSEQRWISRLNGRADDTPDKQQQDVRKAVGAWSLAEFSRQQENSVESRIEKNTRETARLLRERRMTY
jgi:hypothetical protein